MNVRIYRERLISKRFCQTSHWVGFAVYAQLAWLFARAMKTFITKILWSERWPCPLTRSFAMLFATIMAATSQPIITGQPTNKSVSIGAAVSFRVFAVTTNPPITYRWRLDGTNLSSATNSSLSLISIQLANAGTYDVVLADSAGSITSQIATLDVDPTFTKITTVLSSLTPEAGALAPGAIMITTAISISF
jgi:hypothetical protein